jgi:hypothetical protein
VPYGADLGGRGRPHQRAHHGGHLGVGAGVQKDHRSQGLYRTGRELPDRRRARKNQGKRGRKTKLCKRGRKTTYQLDLSVHPALTYKDLLGPEGGEAAAEGP